MKKLINGNLHYKNNYHYGMRVGYWEDYRYGGDLYSQSMFI